MSSYTPVTNFLSKDSLVSGNPLKALKGAELSTEFAAVAIAVNSKPDGAVTYFPDGSATQPSVGFTNNAGTGMYNVAGQLSFATGGTLRATISAAGIFTVTGNDIVDSQSAIARVAAVSTGTNAVTVSMRAFDAGAEALIGTQSNHPVNFRTNDTDRFIISAAGASSFSGAVSATLGLAVSGGAFSSRGIADNATFNAMTIDSSGNVNVANGTGSQSPVYAGIPQNSQGSNYTTVLADANKHIFFTGTTATFTIPANASLAYPVGTTITFVNGGSGNLLIACGDTLQLAGTTTTGTRTLNSNKAIATAFKIFSTVWVISGNGIT